MSIEKLEKQVTQLKARLAEIPAEKAALERAPEREQQRLDQARMEVEDLTSRIKSGAAGEHGAELTEALREVAKLENRVAEVERSTAPKLDKLRAEEQKLRDDLTRTNREIAKVRLSEAVDKYQSIMREALPHADSIRRHAAAAGVMLPPNYNDDDHHLIERGTFVIGGVVVELR